MASVNNPMSHSDSLQPRSNNKVTAIMTLGLRRCEVHGACTKLPKEAVIQNSKLSCDGMMPWNLPREPCKARFA